MAEIEAPPEVLLWVTLFTPGAFQLAEAPRRTRPDRYAFRAGPGTRQGISIYSRTVMITAAFAGASNSKALPRPMRLTSPLNLPALGGHQPLCVPCIVCRGDLWMRDRLGCDPPKLVVNTVTPEGFPFSPKLQGSCRLVRQRLPRPACCSTRYLCHAVRSLCWLGLGTASFKICPP